MSGSVPQCADAPRDKAPRIAYLESIRGLAALQVLLLHFFGAFAPDLVYALPGGATVTGYIHLSPLYFLYDGYSAVYIFFALSGYVLTRSFERHLAQPSSQVLSSQVLARIVRLGRAARAAARVAAGAGRPRRTIRASTCEDRTCDDGCARWRSNERVST